MVVAEKPQEKKGEVIKSKGWLGEVEGLRGLASLWVFALHAAVACGATLPIISSGGRGVDLFILISGFIMVHQFQQRETLEPWNKPATIWRFWIRRFFRIAPLYYPMLFLSLTFGRFWGNARDIIQSQYPIAATELARYGDRSIENYLAHLTFTFGMMPHFAFRTPLPDWSLGLEFQFYAVFPLVMLLVLKFGYHRTILVVSTLSLLITLLLSLYFRSFAIESFLPLRMYLFGMGMLIAARMHSETEYILPWLVVLPVAAHFAIPGINFRLAGAQIFLACLFYVVTVYRGSGGQRFFGPVRGFLNHKVIQKLGTLSYSIYLLHSLVLLPVCALLLKQHWFLALPALIRFLVSIIVNGSIVLPLSMLLYKFLEKPGVRWGKWFSGKMLPEHSGTVIVSQ
jgi:peptidoglycan/LPS O-acetylase OafA/YrhL